MTKKVNLQIRITQPATPDPAPEAERVEPWVIPFRPVEARRDLYVAMEERAKAREASLSGGRDVCHRLDVEDGAGVFRESTQLRNVQDVLAVVRVVLDQWDPCLVFGASWTEDIDAIGLPRLDRRAFAAITFGCPWYLEDGLPELDGRLLTLTMKRNRIQSVSFCVAGLPFGRNHQAP